MFPHQTTIQLLELRLSELNLDLLQERQVSDALGELVEDRCDLIAELRNKITALEAIIQEDAKKERCYSHVYTSLGMQKTIGRARGSFAPLKATRRKLADDEIVMSGDIVVKNGFDYTKLDCEGGDKFTVRWLVGDYNGLYEVWRPTNGHDY